MMPGLPGFLSRRLFAARLVAPDGVKHLAPVHRDFFRGLNSETDFVSANVNHGDNDVASNNNLFVYFSGKNQHRAPPAGKRNGSLKRPCLILKSRLYYSKNAPNVNPACASTSFFLWRAPTEIPPGFGRVLSSTRPKLKAQNQRHQII